MTPKEFKAELTKLAREIGPKADLSAHIGSSDAEGLAIYCGVYPHGHSFKGQNYYFYVQADDFAALLIAVRVKWAELADHADKEIVRKMALAVMRITADFGRCTDAALRQEFSEGEIEAYGARACKDADCIAGKGPFIIMALGGANGAPADVEATGRMQ